MRLSTLLADVLPSPVAFVRCDPDSVVTGLCVDSRNVAGHQGCAFLATRGATVDAHRFVEDALAQGAAVAIVEAGCTPAPSGPYVALADPSAAYPQIAANAWGRPAAALRLAAITGTNGKTTATHLLGSILEAAGLRFTRLGTAGNWVVDRHQPTSLTTPFPLQLQALLRTTVDRGGTHAVMEASSHALEQGRVKPLSYDAVGFTSFSQDHLDFHPSMDAYLAAKCRLCTEHLAEGGYAVAAVDDQPAALTFLRHARDRQARCLRVSRGEVRRAEIVADQVEYGPQHTRARVHTPAGTVALRTPLIAPFNLDNAMVALGMALGLGIALKDAAQALSTATGAPGRLERVRAENVPGPIVVVDYAHTPDAITRALAAVRPLCAGKLHLVLGCGGDRDPSKRPQMGSAAARGADVVWATSDNPRTEPPDAIIDAMLAGLPSTLARKIHREVDRATAIAQAITEAAPEDLVLIAGKGHETSQILGAHAVPFDDRDHARRALRDVGRGC